MEAKKRFQSEALQIAFNAGGGERDRPVEFEEELTSVDAAKLIRDMRTKAGLSQAELARRVGTTAASIGKLEAPDFDGHAVTDVRKIAAAMNRRLELRAVPIKKGPARAR